MDRRTGLLIVGLAAASFGAAAQNEGRPGDYGYRHQDYHRRGLIDELRRKTGMSCCDRVGECRATYVDMARAMAYIDGNWCPLGSARVRRDIELPDQFSLVCAGSSAPPFFPCPIVYCVALAPGT